MIESLLAFIEIESSSKYKFKSETNIGSMLLLDTLLPPPSLLSLLLPLPSHNIS